MAQLILFYAFNWLISYLPAYSSVVLLISNPSSNLAPFSAFSLIHLFQVALHFPHCSLLGGAGTFVAGWCHYPSAHRQHHSPMETVGNSSGFSSILMWLLLLSLSKESVGEAKQYSTNTHWRIYDGTNFVGLKEDMTL